jgi:ribosomal RNA-processing protein 8
MFAVPGWSVPSAAPKVHTSGIFQPEKPQTDGLNPTSKAARKRKHAHGFLEPPQVSAANLDYLWETVVEKKPPPKRLEVAKKHDRERQKEAEGKIEILEPDTEHAVTSNTERLGLIENRKATKRKKRKRDVEPQSLNNATSIKTPNVQPLMTKIQLTPLQVSMKQKLMSARFRHLNQTLYTTPSADSLELFEENPEMFREYHEGFRRQVEIWPENPVMSYVAQIRQRGKLQILAHDFTKMSNSQDAEQSVPGAMPLPRTKGTCSIADLGCGEAALSIALSEEKDKLKVKVFNYDLQSTSPLVQKADIANLPLPDGSIDVAILCLALMGTNWIDFVEEAFRILRWKGELWLTEIKSRFSRVGKKVDYSPAQRKKSGIKSSKGIEGADDFDAFMGVNDQESSKGETDVSAFIDVLRRRGFILQDNTSVDLSNKMFVKMNFVKGRTPVMGKCVPLPTKSTRIGKATRKKSEAEFLDERSLISREADTLKPCVYKLR